VKATEAQGKARRGGTRRKREAGTEDREAMKGGGKTG
jgi:hypothetical protein